MTMELSKVKIEDIFPNLLRIIDGGIKNNKAMVMQYGERLAEKFDKSGDVLLANCIRDQLYGGVTAVMDNAAKSTGDTNIDNEFSDSQQVRLATVAIKKVFNELNYKENE